MFSRLLVANRGEIAVRIIRACRELGVAPIAVYSDADRDALHATMADEAYRIGPAAARASYLDADKLLEVAASSGCDALHPGYGFFAESADFARRCAERSITFVGPSPEAIERMGDKIAARQAAQEAGLAIVPGSAAPVRSIQEARRIADALGFPVAVKAAAGGGGKGLKVALDRGELDRALALAVKEAGAYFGDDTVYIERYLARPKHVEVQVVADRHGHVLHMGERDCSLQRRHQKLIEETPAAIDQRLRADLHAAACRLARAIRYDSIGTIECLVEDDRYYFLEMNTRVQVEHTVTEMTWGVDLVKAQLRIAAGEPLWLEQEDLYPRGHAIECRINAESPAADFRASSGRISAYAPPAGPGVRIDSAAFSGWIIPADYDSLVAKLAVWGQDREEARLRMLRALGEFVLRGIDTTIPLFRWLLAQPVFADSGYDTTTVETLVNSGAAASAHAQASVDGAEGSSGADRDESSDGSQRLVVEVNAKRFDVRVHGPSAGLRRPDDAAPLRRAVKHNAPKLKPGGSAAILAPMHGLVAEINVGPGDTVAAGQVVAIIEAMKMMNEVIAQRSGRVDRVSASVGDTVEAGYPLVSLAEE